MGNFVGLSDTQFVGAGELGAVSSYQPCHVFGDATLIGAGIRIGFYLLYAAAMVAVLSGVDQQFRIWNTAWATVALSTFVALVVSSTPRTCRTREAEAERETPPADKCLQRRSWCSIGPCSSS